MPRKSKKEVGTIDSREAFALMRQKRSREKSRTSQGSKLATVRGQSDTLVGLRIPLALQYVIDAAVLPLGCVFEINAIHQSHKSMLGFEFGRIFADHGGFMNMILSESKLSTKLARSLIGYEPDRLDAFYCDTVSNTDEMQACCYDIVRDFDDIASHREDGRKAAGWDRPVLLAIDSIAGAIAKEKADKIDKTGHASRDYSTENLYLTTFLKHFSDRIRELPVLLLTINHRKEDASESPYEAAKVRKAGSKQLQFQATYSLQLKAKKNPPKLNANPDQSGVIESRQVTIINDKNSGGTNGREISVELTWHDDIWRGVDGESDPVQIQRTKFHWEAALVKLLISYQKGKIPGTFSKAVVHSEDGKRVSPQAALDMRFHLREKKAGSHGTLYWSKFFGMTEADAVPAAKMGQMIENDPGATQSLRLFFGMNPGKIWSNEDGDFIRFHREFKETDAVRNQKELTEWAMANNNGAEPFAAEIAVEEDE